MALTLAVSSLVAACTPVPPQARGKLAHPTMSASRLVGPGESHMQAVHEGASGGSIGAESGCGCN